MIFLFPFSFLYIPIWFYSNGNTRNDDKFNANFTFQSGSIQIHLQPYTQEHRLPLHSNLVLFKLLYKSGVQTSNISLHSNLVLFKWKQRADRTNLCTVFTFQSGSIQIVLYLFENSSILSFTFQSGSIQIQGTCAPKFWYVNFTFQSGSIQI